MKGLWFESVVGTTDKFSHEAGRLDPWPCPPPLSKGRSCCRPRRTGERRRRSVRGCVVDANLRVLCLVIVKKGEKDIPGLTDTTVPHRLGPKSAGRIRNCSVSKEDGVCQDAVRKPLSKEGKRPRATAPKSQRLATPRVLQHTRGRIALKKQRAKNKEEAAEYAKLLAERVQEAKKSAGTEPRDVGCPL
ncbi:small ribosomal subunit protein eS6-like [Molossus nigricans]